MANNNGNNGTMNGTQAPQQPQGMPVQGAPQQSQMDPGMNGNPAPQFQQGMPQQGFQGMPQAQQPQQPPKMPISERIAMAAYKGTKWVCEKIPVILGTAAVTVAGYCIYKGVTGSDSEPQSPYTLPQQPQYPDNGYGYGYSYPNQIPQQQSQMSATISSENNSQTQQPQMNGFEVNKF